MEPNWGERVPYLLAEGEGRVQAERARSIEDFMKQPYATSARLRMH